MTILVDAGPLIADADRRDNQHDRVRAFFNANREPLLVPITVIPEVCHLLSQRGGAHVEIAFVRAMVLRELPLEPVTSADLPRCMELMEQYADFPLGFVDASVIALAERLNITRILTLDRRHFSAVRPRHVGSFQLLP